MINIYQLDVGQMIVFAIADGSGAESIAREPQILLMIKSICIIREPAVFILVILPPQDQLFHTHLPTTVS